MKFSIKDFFSKCDQIRSVFSVVVYSPIIIQPLLNPFHATALFLYPLKKKGSIKKVEWNELRRTSTNTCYL